MNTLIRCGASIQKFIIKRTFFGTNVKRSILDVNTKVRNDIILYKYENPKFYKVLNIFGIVQFSLMMYMSHFVFTALKDVPVSERHDDRNEQWWRKVNLGEKKYRNGFASLCAALGALVLCGAWTFTLRSVRFLVLRKGGESVSFVTYGPFGVNRITTVPINKVCSVESREKAKVTLPIKVKGHYFHYMLDMRGDFRNKQLYDSTVGLFRNLK